MEEVDIPEEVSVDQRVVPFADDNLMATLSESGSIYISIPNLCKALGLDSQGQLQRMQRTPNLAKGLRKFRLQTSKRGAQMVNCIRLGKVAMWLAGVETGRMTNRKAAAKVDLYQEELEPKATEVFMRTMAMGVAQQSNMTTTPVPVVFGEAQGVEVFLEEHLRMMVDDYMLPHLDQRFDAQTTKLDQIISMLSYLVSHQEVVLENQEALLVRQADTEDEVAKISERTQHLSPAHKRRIKETIDSLVRTTRNTDEPLSYIMIYGKLKRQYRVTSYAEIADDFYEDVMQFLQALPTSGPPRLF